MWGENARPHAETRRARSGRSAIEVARGVPSPGRPIPRLTFFAASGQLACTSAERQEDAVGHGDPKIGLGACERHDWEGTG